MNYPDPTWCNKEGLPLIGTECPKCGQSPIENNNFTSKKGEQFESVVCKKCWNKWIVSNKTFKSGGNSYKKLEERVTELEKKYENLATVVKILREKL